MFSVQDEYAEFNVKSLRANYFCIGKKKGKRYVCFNAVNDPETINKAVELLIEAINRTLRWQLWNTWWIDKYEEELLVKRKSVEEKLRGKYDDKTVDAIIELIDRFINYTSKLRNYWLRNGVNYEIRNLIENLINGKTEVIIRGNNTSGISVHEEYITLNVDKTNTGVTVHLKLKGFKSMNIKVPDVFKMIMSEEKYKEFVNEVLNGLRRGFEETDGHNEYGKASMSTAQTGQAIAWALLYPGKVRININTVNINKNDVTIQWQLRSNDYNSLKGSIIKDIDKLSVKTLLAFMITAILGDGSAYIHKIVKDGRIYDEPVIEIAMSAKKFKIWKPLLDRLWNVGFKWGESDLNENAIEIGFYGSNAIDLARAMINILPPILTDLMNAFNFEKWMT